MKLSGTHTHSKHGVFTYTAEYTTRQSGSTWFVDWSAIATGMNGMVLELSGGTTEIIVGSSGAAPLVVEKQIREEINAL